MQQKYYFSLQYSAIQKTILRHDRLWSMAGISNLLSQLNEITMPRITKDHYGRVFVAGGGKYTGIFNTREDAENAKERILKEISTTFPMLEYQYLQQVLPAQELKEIKENLIDELRQKKTEFRGCGLSFNPHLKMCDECNEYPAVEKNNKRDYLCRFCSCAQEAAKINLRQILKFPESDNLTTMELIYAQYFKLIKNERRGNNVDLEQNLAKLQIPNNFEDLFASNGESSSGDTNGQERRRMAVWFSDINNMNGKVPIWFDQEEEEVFEIFTKVKKIFIQVTAQALADTFTDLCPPYLPFRIIIAGGDDLCLVMDSRNILEFAENMSKAFVSERERIKGDDNNYLNPDWLNRNRKEKSDQQPIKPYSFGSSFVITDIHTPFRLIHEIGETLMSEAKQETDRIDNSINWRIMADDDSETDRIHDFEKPLLIDSFSEHGPKDPSLTSLNSDKMAFKDYLALIQPDFNISSSHMHQIVKKIKETAYDPVKVENWLKSLDDERTGKSFSKILIKSSFKDKEGLLNLKRIMTFFELLTIKRNA